MPIEIRSMGLFLHMTLRGLDDEQILRGLDDEQWIDCHVLVDVPGVHGEFDVHMLLSDLTSFRDQLVGSIDPSNWPCEVCWTSIEPGIDLRLEIDRRGRVQGVYRLGGDDAYKVVLSGEFFLDQTYLGPLLAQVERALVERK